MKYLIFSDLHGSAKMTRWLIQKYHQLGCNRLICLGDVLYHGPRNDLPEEYAPKEVVRMLNELASDILAIQGNCDAEVDQMVLKFPLFKNKDIVLNNHLCHLEHGHHLEELQSNAELNFYGHTHISEIKKQGSQLYLNPGSITIPKNGLPQSYMLFDEDGIFLYSIEDDLLDQYLF